MQEVLQDFKVRFVPSFVVITLGSSLPQIHTHCFSNTPDFAAHLSTHFPNITSDCRYESHSFLPFPSDPVSTGVITYSTTYHPMPNVFYLLLVLLYATGILKDKAGVRDEHGKGWNAEGYDAWRGECARFNAVVLNAYMECLALYQEDKSQEILSTTMMTFSCNSTCPLSTQRLQLRTHSVYSTFTNKSYRFAPPTHSVLFITSFLRLSLRLKDESTIRLISRNCASLWNYAFSRPRPERQTTSSLLPSTIQYSIPAKLPSS